MADLGADASPRRARSAILRRAPVAVVLDTAAGIVQVRAGGQAILRRALRADAMGSFWRPIGIRRCTTRVGSAMALTNLTVTVRERTYS